MRGLACGNTGARTYKICHTYIYIYIHTHKVFIYSGVKRIIERQIAWSSAKLLFGTLKISDNAKYRLQSFPKPKQNEHRYEAKSEHGPVARWAVGEMCFRWVHISKNHTTTFPGKGKKAAITQSPNPFLTNSNSFSDACETFWRNELNKLWKLIFKLPCAPADHAPTGLRKWSDYQVFRANQLHLLELEADDNQQ